MSLLSLLLLASVDAEAGSRTINSSGSPLIWQVDEVTFTVNPNGKHGLDPDDVTDAIDDAAAEWQLDGSWISLVNVGETSADVAAYDDEQVVFFDDEWSDKLDPNLLALTYVWSQSDGEILHFDIAINSEDHDWGVDGGAQVNDLWNAMSHEFGHALGLDHSEDTEATMYSKTSVGELKKRDLAQDDMEMFAGLYGGSFPFEAVGLVGCSAGGGSAAGWGVLAGLLALCSRRRDNKEQ